jgi:uncharacterized membrane protein YraQ (UPF0718 family)
VLAGPANGGQPAGDAATGRFAGPGSGIPPAVAAAGSTRAGGVLVAEAGPGADGGAAAAGPRVRSGRQVTSTDVLTGLLVVVILARPLLSRLFEGGAVRTWTTIFVAVCVQALPFLVLGVLLSAAIAVFVPASFFARALPRRQALAVPVAGVAGAVLPGCECSSVPVARGLMARGVAPSAALAFLLSAPAINPVVLVATSVAFPGRPQVVLARFLASLATAVVVGWIWARFGRAEWFSPPRRPELGGLGRWEAFRVSARHDFVHAGGFLVVGGLTAATLNVAVPRGVLDAVASSPWFAVLALAGLAVLLAICSEADAFVAASLTQFSLTAKLAFMVVGPTVDVKLVALQAGTFGRRFAVRFAPLTFVVAVVASVLIGGWLLS